MSKTNIHFDFNQFKKIEDIIYLDEPILTHLTKNNKHYLQYLVDTLEEVDIYLVLELEEETIFNYLTKRITLREVITSNQNFIYKVKQDFSGKVVDVEITESQQLQNDYLPSEKSFLNYEPSEDSYYFNFIKVFEEKTYLNLLREQAFYLKLAPKNSKYADTIGFNELVGELLKNISTSFKSFLKADFFESFKKIQTDVKKLNSSFSRIVDDLDYRMVDLKFGSFEIGLAVDKVMKGSIENKEIREWAIDVGYKYKNTVLDTSYDSDIVDSIISNYTPEDRRKIFEPIFKITENPNFDLNIKNTEKEEYSKIKIKDKSTIDKIAPPKVSLLDENKLKEYEIIQVTTIKEKDKISRSIKLDSNTLFESSKNKEVTISNKDFEKYDFHIDDEINAQMVISTEGNSIILTTHYDGIEFSKILDSGKLDEGMKQIVASIYEYILNKKE